MQLLNTKTFEELTLDADRELRSIGFSTRPGAIAKLFLNIVNRNIADLYDTLTVNHLRAFLTTTKDDGVDLIGALLKCQRLNGESDENYKYRISNQCLNLATSNETAVYLSCLIIDGVNDVILRPYSMGSGTFTVIVITDEINSDEIITAVKTALSKTAAFGVRYDIITPVLVPIKLGYQLYISDKVSDTTKQEIRYNVQGNLMEYIQGLGIGEAIYVEKLNQVIMNTSPDILSLTNINYKIKDETALYVNQSCRWMERFIISQDNDNVIIS